MRKVYGLGETYLLKKIVDEDLDVFKAVIGPGRGAATRT